MALVDVNAVHKEAGSESEISILSSRSCGCGARLSKQPISSAILVNAKSHNIQMSSFFVLRKHAKCEYTRSIFMLSGNLIFDKLNWMNLDRMLSRERLVHLTSSDRR